jgi:hypothetical protein
MDDRAYIAKVKSLQKKALAAAGGLIEKKAPETWSDRKNEFVASITTAEIQKARNLTDAELCSLTKKSFTNSKQ